MSADDGSTRVVDSGRTDTGSATVELLGAGLLLMLPLLYLVVTLGAIQAATFAVEGAAREAARASVTSSADDAAHRVDAAVAIAVGDHGLDDADVVATVTCSDDCRTPGTHVTATVEATVPLPGVPGLVRDVVPLTVPVSATVTAPVDSYAGRG